MDKYRRVNKWWEDKARECIFCHSKLSVKYDVPILVPSCGCAKELGFHAVMGVCGIMCLGRSNLPFFILLSFQ